MNPNSFQYQAFWYRTHAPAIAAALAIRLRTLHDELSATARRLAPADPEITPIHTAPALLRDGCRALDRVAELPVLARQTTRQAGRRVGPVIVAQADMLASVATDLIAVLRGETGTGGSDLGWDLGISLGGSERLGPNETDESLILVAETLSLAAQLVLILARLSDSRARRGLVCQAMRVFSARAVWLAEAWAVRVVSLRLSADLVHVWLSVSTTVSAVVVLAGLAVLLRRFAAFRSVRALADLISVVTEVALPHLAPAALIWAALPPCNLCQSQSRALGHVGQPSPERIRVTSRARRVRRDGREQHRDQ